MKRTIFLLILVMLLITTCGCSDVKDNNVTPSDTTEAAAETTSDVTTAPNYETQTGENDLLNDSTISKENVEDIIKNNLQYYLGHKNSSPDGMHYEMYFRWKDYAYKFVDDANKDEFSKMMDFTMSGSMGGFIDYFGINKEDYSDAIEEYFSAGFKEWQNYFWVVSEYDALFSEQYFEHPAFCIDLWDISNRRSVTVRPSSEISEHTNIYHTIDFRLINYVGGRDFKEFYDKYAGGLDFNIVNFVEYFEISKEEYVEIIEDFYKGIEGYFIGINPNCYIYPYNPDYLYGTEEMREQYFCRHPELLLSNISKNEG